MIAYPKSVEEVSGIVKLCNEARVPIIPFGTGTGLEGGVVPVSGGVTVALQQMDKVLEINVEDSDCFVEAGVTRRKLNEIIRDMGVFFSVGKVGFRGHRLIVSNPRLSF